MMNAPWLLPLWILGVPLLLAVIDFIRTPKAHTTAHESRQRAVSFPEVPA